MGHDDNTTEFSRDTPLGFRFCTNTSEKLFMLESERAELGMPETLEQYEERLLREHPGDVVVTRPGYTKSGQVYEGSIAVHVREGVSVDVSRHFLKD